MKKLVGSMVPLYFMSVAVLGVSIRASAATINRDIGSNSPALTKRTDVSTNYSLRRNSISSLQIPVSAKGLPLAKRNWEWNLRCPRTDSLLSGFRFVKPHWEWNPYQHHRRGGGPPIPAPEPSVPVLCALGLAGIALKRVSMSTNHT